MNILLIFFAIPLAVIILSAIFETFINCPLKVAGIFFSIFIVVAFALGGTAILIVAAILYTIISFITAVITRFIINRRCNSCGNTCENLCESSRNCNNCNTCTTCNLNNNINTLNELNRLGIGLRSNLNTQNVLADSSNLNENNLNNTCRRYR